MTFFSGLVSAVAGLLAMLTPALCPSTDLFSSPSWRPVYSADSAVSSSSSRSGPVSAATVFAVPLHATRFSGSVVAFLLFHEQPTLWMLGGAVSDRPRQASTLRSGRSRPSLVLAVNSEKKKASRSPPALRQEKPSSLLSHRLCPSSRASPPSGCPARDSSPHLSSFVLKRRRIHMLLAVEQGFDTLLRDVLRLAFVLPILPNVRMVHARAIEEVRINRSRLKAP